jgi:hypothetical protein
MARYDIYENPGRNRIGNPLRKYTDIIECLPKQKRL